MVDRILVGIDGSQGSRFALEWAAGDAMARGVVIDAVTVCRGAGEDRAEGYFPYMVSHRMDVPAHVQADQARQRLLGLVSEVAARFPTAVIEPHVYQGDPAETLCRRAQEAEALVVGARGHGTFAALLLGSVAAKCASHSPGPVVIVPAPAGGEPGHGRAPAGRIVVGVDMSVGSRHALRWAIEEAEARNWAVQAVNVWDTSYGFDADFSWPASEKLEARAKSRLSQIIDEVARVHPAVRIDPLVFEGDPAQKLFELAGEAELLVVGCRGHSAVASLFLGSVATKCAYHSPCPVAIVHHHLAEQGPNGRPAPSGT